MKNSLLEDIRKLKKSNSNYGKDPCTQRKQKKQKKNRIQKTHSQSRFGQFLESTQGDTQSQIQSKNTKQKQEIKIFSQCSFCFPIVNIELSPKRIQILKKTIIRFGGIIKENIHCQKQQYIDYVLVSNKTKIQNIKKILNSSLTYKNLLDFQFIIDCQNQFTFLNPSSYQIHQEADQVLSSQFEHKLTKKLILEETDHELESQYEIKSLKTSSISTFVAPRQRFACQKGTSSSQFIINKFICDELMKLQNIYENQKDIGRKIGYLKAISSIKCLSFQIQTEKDVESLRGVGKKILLKIKELLNTGHIQKLQALKTSQTTKISDQFCRVWGIGPSKASQLLNKGIKSLQQLESHQLLLNNSQKIGLKFVKEFEERIPRQKVHKLYLFVKNVIEKMAGHQIYRIQVCGSYRRGKSTCGDIDIIIANKNGIMERYFLLSLICQLENQKFITHHLSLPKNFEPGKSQSYMGVCQLQTETHHRIDIKHYPLDQYAFAILYFTGSDLFNRSMRLYARKKGYSLSDHGLKKVQRNGNSKTILEKQALAAYSEKQIFQFLQLQYKAPEQRNI